MCLVCHEDIHPDNSFCNSCIDASSVICEKNDYNFMHVVMGSQPRPDPEHRMRPLWDLAVHVNFDDDSGGEDTMGFGAERSSIINRIYGDEIRTIRTMTTLANLQSQ